MVLAVVWSATGGPAAGAGFYRLAPAVNTSNSPSATRLARQTPRSLVLAPSGRATLAWVDRITLQGGAQADEIAVCTFEPTQGWQAGIIPIGLWDGQHSAEPAAVADCADNIHLAWIERRQAGAAVVALQLGPDLETASPVAVVREAKSAQDPALAASDEAVHAVWSELQDTGRIFYSRRLRRASFASWAPPVRLETADSLTAYTPEVAASGDGAHVVFALAGRHGAGIAYAFQSGDAFGPLEWVAPLATGNFAQTPTVAAHEGRVAVAWAERRDTSDRIRLRVRSADGRWYAPRTLIAGTTRAGQPSVAFDITGRLHVVWEYGPAPEAPPGAVTHILGTALDSLNAPVAIRTLSAPGSGPNRTPTLATDRSGRLGVAWVDGGTGAGDIICRLGAGGFRALGSRAP